MSVPRLRVGRCRGRGRGGVGGAPRRPRAVPAGALPSAGGGGGGEPLVCAADACFEPLPQQPRGRGGGGGGGGGAAAAAAADTCDRRAIECPRCGAATCAWCGGAAPPGGAHTCPSPDDGTPTAAATATAAWALGRVGLCTHCAAPVERAGGCDVVVCTACGGAFAWAPLWAPAAAAGIFGAPPDAVRAAADGAAVRVTVGTPPAPAPRGRPPRALLTCVCVVATFAVAMLPLGVVYGLVLWATGNSSLSWIAVAVVGGLLLTGGVEGRRRRRRGGGGGREPRRRDARRRRRWGRRRHRQWRRGGVRGTVRSGGGVALRTGARERGVGRWPVPHERAVRMGGRRQDGTRGDRRACAGGERRAPPTVLRRSCTPPLLTRCR
ncbi:hypothetical protein BU14_0131s0008 [Porphyra umbilicalis]|uniref:Uncharacterized protein n=1 Tax=Porphyra umbilicalis TaxID=2786 RepID=A0A1X6PAR9_PORUM|nr:hypothetical protein BU14_0131s0008 [Porphyra umbilicalis]|eukprot:OSX77825.1 hypothetical protein BU14_0131s0008 [Porphyra umbilicalis]